MTPYVPTPVGSYDDVPESEVATVLAVPLVWPTTSADGPGEEPLGSSRSVDARRPSRAGRHRTPPSKRTTDRTGSRRRATQSVPARRHKSDADVAHTLRVGLVSAVVVLGLFALTLFALAAWLP